MKPYHLLSLPIALNPQNNCTHVLKTDALNCHKLKNLEHATRKTQLPK